MSKSQIEKPEDASGAVGENEWNFGKDQVSDSEVVACCVWEYARESKFIRELRRRSWEHWKPLYKKARWWDSPRDESLHQDLQKAQSIGYRSEVFLRGVACPPDGVLPDAPPLQAGEVHSVTGSFPRPWQSLTAKERNYRSRIRTDAESIPLLPFERGHSIDAKDIREWVVSRRTEIDAANDAVRRENPKKSEEALCREGKLKFETINPSLYWESGREVTVVAINWGAFTDDEIATYFRKWIQANRPAHISAPNGQGRKLSDWRVALNRLGTMRSLHAFTFADKRFPRRFKEQGEKHCYAARRLALKKFRDLFPFLPPEETPLSWLTKGNRSK
jgi:hypothetical protein